MTKPGSLRTGIFALAALAALLIGALAVAAGRSDAGDEAGSGENAGPAANPHGSFSADCALCHAAESWKPAVISKQFDHAKHGFALTGAHAAVACRACHATLDFKRAKADCVDCHHDVHRGELGTDCGRCHTTRNFIERAEEARRHRLTRFPLLGAHAAADCQSCHRNAASGQMMFVNTPSDCEACHLDDYNAAKNPDHAASGFPHDCTQCHSAVAWQASRFNHDLTGFPLQGAHRSLPCDACHAGGTFGSIPADCYSCHQADYTQTTNPAHAAGGFATTCQNCHTARAWRPSTFNHAGTAFPLTGAHRSADCNACHGDGVYQGKSALCVSCHQQDYDATTNPGHAAAGFSVDCASCHTTTAWQGATFDHAGTAFPLTGAHRTAACNACHGDGVYQGKSVLCVSCHQQDYDATTNPGHAAAGFPTDCASCHTTSRWQGATFDHDARYFPIGSGTHAGRWNACSDCHINPTTYADFSCFNCHPHSDRAKTDADHQGKSGYQYDSHACYNCHPRGRAGN